MGVKVEKTTTLTIGYDGKKDTKDETLVVVRCDGPKCHEKVSACKGEMSWYENKPDDIPDDAWRLLILSGFVEGTKVVFFSRQCLRDFMRNYVPPLSPKEREIIDKTNEKPAADSNTPAAEPALSGETGG